MIDQDYLLRCFSEQQFIKALRREPHQRTLHELQVIHAHLAGLEALSKLRESALRSLCTMVHYEKHDANTILYRRGDYSTCWYILLCGSAFIDGAMYLPKSSFGKRVGGASRRHNECLILEPSEMIVIDYVDGRGRTEKIIDSSSTSISPSNPGNGAASMSDVVTLQQTYLVDEDEEGPPPPPPPRKQHGSDSSSAYSGSDTMLQSVEEMDLSGLLESVVDSDEEEEEEEEDDEEEEEESSAESPLLVRDAVRDCLEKDPSDRNEEDVEILLEFTQHLKAFTNMTMSVRRALVTTMVFAVVEKSGTVVMTDGEELDSWSVIINGSVEIERQEGSPKEELHLGDSFGITPTTEKLYHKGVMRTRVDDCQFICVTQNDYYRILHQGEENQFRHEEDGKLVMITEHRHTEKSDSSGSATPTNNQPPHHQRVGHVVIRGAPERLTAQLIEDGSVDSTFIEDFLLTYRTFISDPVTIIEKLLEWFEDGSLRDKVTRVLLLWVNNHFTDFETDLRMMGCLEKFEKLLEAEGMNSQLRMLNFACAAKARKRTVTLTRSSREEPLPFQIIGGVNGGIFVSKVEAGSKAEDIGLKRGDEILEVNGQFFTSLKLSRALELLKGVCHLSVTAKSNFLAFQEALMNQGQPASPGEKKHYQLESSISAEDFTQQHPRISHSNRSPSSPQISKCGSKPSILASKTHRLNRAFNRLLHKPKSMISMDTLDDSSVINSNYYHNNNNNSLSNPDLTDNSFDDGYGGGPSSYPEHVLKIYKADQSLKYLLIHKETTAREVVMLALQEFGSSEPSSSYALVEVTVAEGGFVKQRRLPDSLQNLAERMGLASRYYIKNVASSETLLPDDAAVELQKDASVSLLQLNSVEVATQLMVEDFTIFRQIEATEYVTDLFAKKTRFGTPNLSRFSELVNREMMWTITEIVSETSNANKRMRIIKQFIKIARQCKETQNFNSMFAIVSGLGHASVSRLKSTWEKLPAKYIRMFHEMQQLMDPSRNMSRYRNLVNGDDVQPPIIPFYPVVKKDLTFIHIANDSVIDGLVNFEKLRMIAKEVRCLTNMCSAPLDLFSMLELGGQQPSNAMVAMNQLSTGGQHLATVNRRRKKASGVPNPKRMFEEAQMVRRVKSYLNNMKVVTQEETLRKMSLECEPPPGGLHNVSSSSSSSYNLHHNPSSSNQQSLRKRHSSPTPSALSSASSASHNSSDRKNSPPTSNPSSSLQHQKFGAASPQAVKKLLSLSEPSKPSRGSSQKSQQQFFGNHHHHHHHHHHHQQEEPTFPIPVDLTPESSSVTSLPVSRRGNPHYHHHHHNPHRPAGSVASTDSGLSSYDEYSRHKQPISYSRRQHRRVPPPPMQLRSGYPLDFQLRNKRISKQHMNQFPPFYVLSDHNDDDDEDDDDEGDAQVSAV